MTLDELADACEKATGNDLELFEDAFRAYFPTPKRIWITDNTGDWTPEYSEWNARGWEYAELLEAEGFLDAAMALVPASNDAQAVFWRLGNDGEGGNPGDFKAEILIASTFAAKQFPAVAETAALALCAASLRAHAQMKEDRRG